MTTLSHHHDRTSMTMIEDQSAGTDYVVLEERRMSPRSAPGWTVHLSGLGRAKPFECPAENISECGLFVCLPGDLGVCVGARCELVLACDGGVPGSPSCVDEPVYATVVRTIPVSDDRIGAGLRFDNPIFF